jgi:hypothetical protein
MSRAILSLSKKEFTTIMENPILKEEIKSKYDVKIKTTNPKQKYNVCKICFKQYLRNNKSNHEKTKYHKIHHEVNRKLHELLFLNNNLSIE